MTIRHARACSIVPGSRVGGAKVIAEGLKHFDEFPLPDEDPSYNVDYDEQGPYVAEVGAGECAGE